MLGWLVLDDSPTFGVTLVQMPYVSNGVFITFEGTEGAGKSTLIRAFAKLLRKMKYLVKLTREPGGSPLSEKIRSLILKEPMNPWTELFLYEAARAEHISQTILPSLKKGTIVLCDRFTDSTLAYQGFARNLPWNAVQKLNRYATLGLTPQSTVFLDIEPALGLKRAQVKNRFEKEGIRFQMQVRKGFLKARASAPQKWITIKAHRYTPEEMAQELIRVLTKKKILKKIQHGSV